MATSEAYRSTELNSRLLKEGEVSPYKILVSLLLREFYTHLDLKPIQPKLRIQLGIFFYKLISSQDISYKTLLSICKNQQCLAPEVFVSFMRIVEQLEEENSCFLNELVVTVIDMIDTSQTVILRKRVAKTSPLGKFLRLVMLSIRKMSYPQIFHLYRKFWIFIKKDDIRKLKSIATGKLVTLQILNKGFHKLYVQQHPPLQKGIKPKRGLDLFNEALHKRSSSQRVGLGPNLDLASLKSNEILIPKTTLSESIIAAESMEWEEVKWQSRKIIERTIRFVFSEYCTTGSWWYTPSQISNFIESIRNNPSSHVILSQLNFLEYLNCIKLKDLTRCSESLRTAFDLKMKPATSELNKGTPYAAYNFALFYDFMGYKRDSKTLLGEAFQAAHASCDKLCLHFCNNLWASMHNVPYKAVIQEPLKEIDKCLSYLHSFNVTSAAIDLQTSGSRPLEVFQTVWKRSTGFDFENTESFLIISLANLFSILGDIEGVEFMVETVLYTAHTIKWPIRSYSSALLLYGSAAILQGNFGFARQILEEYGQRLFRGDGSIAGETFGKYCAVYQAMQKFLGRKPISDTVIATIRGFDTLESSYWSAYNQMVRKDWQRSIRLIRYVWESLKERTYENGDITIRVLLLEAEINCLSGNPSGALHSLFEALQLSRKLSADFYVAACQLSICTIQIFLGLPSTAAKTLQCETLVKCRSASKSLEAKLCVVTAKVSMKMMTPLTSSPLPIPNYSVKEVQDLFPLFTKTVRIQSKHKETKRLQMPGFISDIFRAEKPSIEDGDAKLASKVEHLLSTADRLYKELENDYLLGEVMYLQCHLYRLVKKEEKALEVEKEASKLNCYNPDFYGRTCII